MYGLYHTDFVTTQTFEIRPCKSSNFFFFKFVLTFLCFFAFPYKLWNDFVVTSKNSAGILHCNCLYSIGQFENCHLKTIESSIHEHDISLHLFIWLFFLLSFQYLRWCFWQFCPIFILVLLCIKITSLFVHS